MEPHKMVMLRMNQRIHAKVMDYCVLNDISQREFIELAAETLIINEEFARKIKTRRAKLLEDRARG